MAVATNAFADESAGKIERGRGGFYRGFNDVPYITDPDGGIVKSGPRKGLPKRIPYGSPSGAGKLIENTYNLQKWGERRVVLGIGTDLKLIADCAHLATLDVDSDEYKELADRIVVAAKEAAKTNLAAEQGTHDHAILEDDDEGRNWVERAAAGELLGIPVEAQHAMVAAWRHMLASNGLEVLITEASCVDDTWRLAGTLDNLARCTKSLRFRLCTGEIVTIPAGTVLVLDKKTGQLRVAPRSGAPMYWHGYAVQVASYAQSKPYDTEAETRGEWPWPIDQQHALIAHIDNRAAIAGAPVEEICQLVYVDLVAGREHGGATVVSAKEWAKRDDVFSVAQLEDDADGIATIADEGAPAAPPSSAPIDTDIPLTVPTPPEQTLPPAPEAPTSKLRQAQLDRQAIDAAADAKRAADPNALNDVRDEGANLDGDEHASAWRILQDRYTGLPRPSLDWISRIIREAREASVGFQMGGGKTARRFELYRATIHLAAQDYDSPNDRDEVTRALVAAAMESDAPLFPAVTVGHAIGSLDAAGAARFADLATGTTVFGCNSAGQLVLVATELPEQPLAATAA